MQRCDGAIVPRQLLPHCTGFTKQKIRDSSRVKDKEKVLNGFQILCADGARTHGNTIRDGKVWGFGQDVIGAMVSTTGNDLGYLWTVRVIDGKDAHMIHSSQCEGNLLPSILNGRCQKCQGTASHLYRRMRNADTLRSVPLHPKTNKI